MISVRITGKNVGDDFAGPSMVYSHAQPSLIEGGGRMAGRNLEHTRVVHPAGQRASGGLRGTKINSNETRPRSAGRGSVVPTAAPVPTRAAAAARKKAVRAESPAVTRRSEHESTVLPRYENGTSARPQESTATERTIDERHTIDNELKRNADSAMRHKAEKAEKKAKEDMKTNLRARLIQVEKERARRVREKGLADARAQAQATPQHLLPERSQRPATASQASGASSGAGGNTTHQSGLSRDVRGKSFSPARTRQSRTSVRSMDTRGSDDENDTAVDRDEQRRVPKLSGNYILPHKEEFINLYDESVQRKSAVSQIPGFEDHSDGMRDSSSTGSPGVVLQPRRRGGPGSSDGGSESEEKYSDFEDEGGGGDVDESALGKRKRDSAAGRAKKKGPPVHQRQECVGESTVSQWEADRQRERRDKGKKAFLESKQKYIADQKSAREKEKAEREERERRLRDVQRMAELSRVMATSAAPHAARASEPKKRRRIPSERTTRPSASVPVNNRRNVGGDVKNDVMNDDTLDNVAGWAATGDMFVNRYENNASPVLPFPDVLVDENQPSAGLGRNDAGRATLSPPRSSVGLGAAHRYHEESAFDSDVEVDYAVQRPEQRHEDVLVSGSPRLSPSRHLPVSERSRPGAFSVANTVATALEAAVDRGANKERQSVSSSTNRKRPRSAPPARPKKPFVAGSASTASQRGSVGSSRQCLSKGRPVVYKSVDSLPPPPPPPSRSVKKRSESKPANRRGVSTVRARPSRQQRQRHPQAKRGSSVPMRPTPQSAGVESVTDRDLLSLMEEEVMRPKTSGKDANVPIVSDLQKVETAMLESKEAILNLVKLEMERLEVEKRRVTKNNEPHPSPHQSPETSVNETSGSDLGAELGDIRASVASLLPGVLARISLEKTDCFYDSEEDDGVRYASGGSDSESASEIASEEDKYSAEDVTNMDMDETIAWNPQDKPKECHRRNSNISAISQEEYSQEEIELHLGDAFTGNDDCMVDEITDEAGNVYALSAEAEEYRRSAMLQVSPPPCRASSRRNHSSPESGPGSPQNDSPSRRLINNYNLQSDDPMLNARMGMLQDTRAVLARFGTDVPSGSPQRPADRSSRQIQAAVVSSSESDDDFEGDEFDEDVFGNRRVVRENEYDDREYVSSRFARQGYYDDTDGRLQKQLRKNSQAPTQAFGPGPLFVFQNGQSDHRTSKNFKPDVSPKKNSIGTAPSLRNIGQLASVLNVGQGPHQALFRDDDDGEDDTDDDNVYTRNKDGYVEGVAHDDERDVSIISIMARQHLKLAAEDKEKAVKEKLKAEARAMAEAVLSAHRQKHAKSETRQPSNIYEDTSSVDPAAGSVAKHVSQSRDLDQNSVSDDSEADRDRTFWDALLLRPINSGSIETSDLPTSDFQTSQSEVADGPEVVAVSDTHKSRLPTEIIADLNVDRKPTAAELNLRLMEAIKHHEEVVAYGTELEELQHAQALQVATEMVKNVTTQAEKEKLHMKYEQDALLQQQAYELSLAATLRSQQEAEREQARRNQVEWDEMQRRVVRHNDMMDRAHFEADAAQTVANMQNTVELLELERALNQQHKELGEQQSHDSTGDVGDVSSKWKQGADKGAVLAVSQSIYSDDFDEGSEASEERAQTSGKAPIRKEYSVQDTPADEYLKRLLERSSSPVPSESYTGRESIDSDAFGVAKKISNLRVSGGSKGLELLAEYQKEMDERLCAQDKSFKLRLNIIKSKRDQELHILQEQAREEEEMGLDPKDIDERRARSAALIQSIYAESRAELEREKWSNNAKACREVRKFHSLRNDMLTYEEKIRGDKQFSSPPRQTARPRSRNPVENHRSPQCSVNESYASDFVDESVGDMSPHKKSGGDAVRMRLHQSVESIIEESYAADESGPSSVVSEDEIADSIGEMRNSYSRPDVWKSSDSTAEPLASGYEEDFEVSDSFSAHQTNDIKKAVAEEKDESVAMDELRARQEAVRLKHLQVEQLLKSKTDELSRQRELIRLEEEERELDELLVAASTLDIKNSADIYSHRKAMRDEARKRIDELSGGIRTQLRAPRVVPPRTMHTGGHGKPPVGMAKTKPLLETAPTSVSARRKNSADDTGSYDEDFEDDFEDEIPEVTVEDEIGEESDDAISEEMSAERASPSSSGSVEDEEEDDDYYADDTFERENSRASLRRQHISASQKSLRSQDSTDEMGYYAESFASEDGEMLHEKSSKSLLRIDQSALSMGNSNDKNLLIDLDSSIERHRQKVWDLKQQMDQIQKEKVRVSLLQSRQRDRNSLLDEEGQLIKMLEIERMKLHTDKEIIRKELSSAVSPAGKARQGEDISELERLEGSVDALEMSTIEEIAVSKARLALEVAEQRKQEAEEESQRAVTELVHVLEEPFTEELAAFDEQALLEEDSFASNGADLSSSGGSGLLMAHRKVSTQSSSGTNMSDSSIGKKKDTTLRNTVAQRVKETEAATRIQTLSRGMAARKAFEADRALALEVRKEMETNVISGNLVEDHAFTSTAEELMLEDSFASDAGDGAQESSAEEDIGIELAETDNLLSAIDRLKAAADARDELDSKLAQKKLEEEENMKKADLSSSVEVMSGLLASTGNTNGSGMVFDEDQLKWVEVGDDVVDMDGFESSQSVHDVLESVGEEFADVEASSPLKLSEALSSPTDPAGTQMVFDEDAMAWVGDDVDMDGFESNSSTGDDTSKAADNQIETPAAPAIASPSDQPDDAGSEDSISEEIEEVEEELSSDDEGDEYSENSFCSGDETSAANPEDQNLEDHLDNSVLSVPGATEGVIEVSSAQSYSVDSSGLDHAAESQKDSYQFVEDSKEHTSLEKSALSLSAASELADETVDDQLQSADSHILSNVEESQKAVELDVKTRTDSADAPNVSLSESGAETVNWAEPPVNTSPSVVRIPSIEEISQADDENEADDMKSIETAVTAGTMATLESYSVAPSPLVAAPSRGETPSSRSLSPPPDEIEEEDDLSLPSHDSDVFESSEAQDPPEIQSFDVLGASTSSIASAGKLSPLSRSHTDKQPHGGILLEASLNSSFGSRDSVGSRSGILAPLSGNKLAPLEDSSTSVLTNTGVPNKPILGKILSPTSQKSNITSPGSDPLPDKTIDSIDEMHESVVEESSAMSIVEDLRADCENNQAVSQLENEVPLDDSTAEKEAELIDQVTNEIWARLVQAELASTIPVVDVEDDASSPAPIAKEKSIMGDEMDDVGDKLEVVVFAEEKPASQFLHLQGLPTFPSVMSVPEDEKIQMHVQLSHELDDLYDFDDDVGNVAVPKAALPVEQDEKSAAEIEAENDVYKQELRAKQAAMRGNFWRNRSAVYAVELMSSPGLTDSFFQDTLGNPNHQGSILSEDTFMNLESERFQRVSTGDEAIKIPMSDIVEFVEKHPVAFKDTPNVANDENVSIDDLMVYNKSVFDMCNTILGDLHNLRHFGRDVVEVFSKKSAFANRFLAETMPLTRDAVSTYVMARVRKMQQLKRDVDMSKRPLDSLADSSRATEEFERQYDFLLAQSVDETTDILMARLLLDTAQYFQQHG